MPVVAVRAMRPVGRPALTLVAAFSLAPALTLCLAPALTLGFQAALGGSTTGRGRRVRCRRCATALSPLFAPMPVPVLFGLGFVGAESFPEVCIALQVASPVAIRIDRRAAAGNGAAAAFYRRDLSLALALALCLEPVRPMLTLFLEPVRPMMPVMPVRPMRPVGHRVRCRRCTPALSPLFAAYYDGY